MFEYKNEHIIFILINIHHTDSNFQSIAKNILIKDIIKKMINSNLGN